jgi:cytochrome P450
VSAGAAAIAVADLDGDPHALLARLRATDPVADVPALGGRLVTRRDLALEVLRDPATYTVDDPRFSTARVVGASMLSTDGAEHARHRAPFAGPFRLKPVRERFAGVVDDAVGELLDPIAPDGHADLRTAFAAPLAARVVLHALGLRDTPPATVLAWYAAIVDAVTEVTAGGDVTAAGRDAAAQLAAAVDRVLDGSAGDSLLAAAGAGAAGLERRAVAANAAVLLFGGIETTEGMIATALLHLLEHPEALARVRADPGLAPAAVEESLRLDPAAAVVDRYATRDAELGGTAIRAGELVRVSITAANRDPDAFADPDRFDLDRPDRRRHLAWAAGPHVCIGMHLARLEAHAAVAAVLERLPGLRLDPARPSAVRGLVFRKPPALAVAWG